MWDLVGAAMRSINHEGMQTLDWVIVIGMIVFLISVLLYCNRYMRNAADFLAEQVEKMRTASLSVDRDMTVCQCEYRKEDKEA